MNKKNKNNNHKKDFNSYAKSNISNSGKGIYTYKKHKKPKRIGKDCIHFFSKKLTCRISGQFCKDAETCMSFVYKEENNKFNTTFGESKHKKEDISNVGITAIVINDNRKCTNQNHIIKDIEAKLRVSVNSTGEIITCKLPAAYCEECNLYFILKEDFKKVKEIGIILCPVIDRTEHHHSKYLENYQLGSESKIHQLGYNVKKGNGYTDKQRHVVLANIIENTNISIHEIKSCIERSLKQHLNQLNYAEAVRAWRNDLEFVNNYRLGDMREVIIDKIVIGKR